jgi:Kef-type K+ transport system membrane component KefB
MGPHEATYTALLMSTGITFGTISALFGLQNKIIDQRQYTLLVTAVILSAVVPTLIAQKFFQPSLATMREMVSVPSHRSERRENRLDSLKVFRQTGYQGLKKIATESSNGTIKWFNDEKGFDLLPGLRKMQ